MSERELLINQLRGTVAHIREAYPLLRGDADFIDQAIAALSQPARESILDGLSQDAIDGGWTYRGMNAYTVRLETSIQKMMARLADLLDEDQFAELERLARPVTPKSSEPAQAQQGESSGWLPIDGAPKDEQPVWVKGFNYGDRRSGIHCCWAWFNGEQWEEAKAGDQSILQYLTHWYKGATP